MTVKKRKTRSKQKNLKRDTRSAAVKEEKFGWVLERLENTRQDRDKCYNCGSFGHWGRDCPLAKKEDGKRKAAAEEEGPRTSLEEEGHEEEEGSTAAAANAAAGEGEGHASPRKKRKDGGPSAKASAEDALEGPDKSETAKKRRKKATLAKVFIGQLAQGTTEENLNAHLKACCEKLEAPKLELVHDAEGTFRGIAFAYFSSKTDAQLAIQEGYKTSFLGKRILLEESSSSGENATTASAHSARVDALVAEWSPKSAFLQEAVDGGVRDFLRSVSLWTVRSTLADAVELEEAGTLEKLERTGKLGDPEARRKFLMGMIKKRT